MESIPAAAWMLPAAFALIFLGVPVAFSLIIVAVGFVLPVFGMLSGIQLYRFIGSVASNYALAAIPLFIFMGAVLEQSGIGKKVYEAMAMWLGRLPGGLSLATMAMCALFAAGTGVVGAVEVMVGLLAIPPMVAAGYSRQLISGTVTAGGSLGTMIPPSIVVVVYASVAQVPIGDLLIATLLPAIIMVGFFIAWIVIFALMRPESAPRVRVNADMPFLAKIRFTLFSLVPAFVLITCVIGSILLGIAAVTEAAAIGALGAVVLNIIYGGFSFRGLMESALKTVLVSSMIMLLVVGGTMFASVFQIQGGARLVSSIINALDMSPLGLIVLFLSIFFIVGMILDWISAVMICTPLFAPFLAPAGIDPLWFGVLAIIMLQTSYLSPPMAPAIFYLKSIAPPNFKTVEMYWGVIPFIAGQMLTAIVVYWMPWLATWLPGAFR